MGLLDRLEDKSPVNKIDKIFDDSEVEDTYKADLLYALISPKYPHITISRELSKDGHQISDASVRRYREKLTPLVLANQESEDE